MINPRDVWKMYDDNGALLSVGGIVVSENIIDRFIVKVLNLSRTGCWIWGANKDRAGYGNFCVRCDGPIARTTKAHRVSWVLANRLDIPDGHIVRHDCDNPSCVNPGHLRTGTHKENRHDAVVRCRLNPPVGEDHSVTKLTESAVRSIRDRHGAGVVSMATLAKEHSVTETAIWCVIHRRSWKHLT